jgi:hypothetical protein
MKVDVWVKVDCGVFEWGVRMVEDGKRRVGNDCFVDDEMPRMTRRSLVSQRDGRMQVARMMTLYGIVVERYGVFRRLKDFVSVRMSAFPSRFQP